MTQHSDITNLFQSSNIFLMFMSEHFTKISKEKIAVAPPAPPPPPLPKFTDAFDEFLSNLATRHHISFDFLRKYFIKSGVFSAAQLARMTSAEKDKFFAEFDDYRADFQEIYA